MAGHVKFLDGAQGKTDALYHMADVLGSVMEFDSDSCTVAFSLQRHILMNCGLPLTVSLKGLCFLIGRRPVTDVLWVIGVFRGTGNLALVIYAEDASKNSVDKVLAVDLAKHAEIATLGTCLHDQAISSWDDVLAHFKAGAAKCYQRINGRADWEENSLC